MTEPDAAWYRDPPKLIPVIVGVLAIITAVTALVRSCAQPPPDVSVEYILDVSRRMEGNLGHKKKLPAVEAEIIAHAKDRPNVATALRLAGGGPCSTGYEPPVVPFGQDNGDKIEQRLRGVRAGGKSDFARAMTHAVNDLVGSESAVESESKTVYIFVGGRDTCAGPRTTRIVKEALRDLRAKANVEVNLKFVGVKAPADVRRVLRAAKQEARQLHFGADVVIADTPNELADALPQAPTPAESQYPAGG
jgi:hypothetical protein